jgi:hypothetical protein
MADTRSPVQKLLQRKAALYLDRQSWDSHIAEIADAILPRAARFQTSTRNQQSRINYARIIDNAATRAQSVCSAGMMAGNTSPARPWFRLKTPDPDLMEFTPVKMWLDQVTQQMMSIFAASNTYRAFHSMYDQITSFGTGASVIVDDYENVLHHYPLVFGSYAIGLNYKGQVDSLYHSCAKTVEQVVNQFGIENVSVAVKNLYDQSNYDAVIPITHAIEPRRDRDVRKADNKNMPVRSIYFEEARDNDKFLSESGYQEFPALCPRWIVEGDDTYASRWPGAVALGDVNQLQQEQLRKSQAIDYMANPPIQIPTAMQNGAFNILPGGHSFYDATNPHGGIRSAFDVNLRLDHLGLDIQDVRTRIDRAFYVDLFMMIANDTRAQPATAREVAERHEEKLLMLGPVLERLTNEMLSPKIDITFNKMQRAGLFNKGEALEPPQELAGVDLAVTFIGTLAQAQRAVGVQSLDRVIGTIGSLMQMAPDVVDKLDADQAIDEYADAIGSKPSIIRSDDEVARIRQQRQKAQAAQQAAQMAPAALQGAQAAKTAAETDPNALQSVLHAFQGYN